MGVSHDQFLVIEDKTIVQAVQVGEQGRQQYQQQGETGDPPPGRLPGAG